MKLNDIQVIDLFAGPGGLGEGFSSAADEAFKILVSAEKDQFAYQTLRLRAYYRLLLRKAQDKQSLYLDFCNDFRDSPWDEGTEDLWREAGEEAKLIELGTESGNAELDSAIQQKLNQELPWVLIGGPPCQAYSLVGRSRNKGKIDYQPENDDRHFLYKEYLRIIQKYRPAIFVMENVKGILSSKVNGELIFHSILKDLSDPDSAFNEGKSAGGYRILSLVKDVVFKRGDSPTSINPHDFIIQAEEYGVPQARHRVILLGVREDIQITGTQLLRKVEKQVSVGEVTFDLPPLRSKLSREEDSSQIWAGTVSGHAKYLTSNSNDQKLGHEIHMAMNGISKHIHTGGTRMPAENYPLPVQSELLAEWYTQNRPQVWLNHEARAHMASDLRRYLYAAAFAKAYNRSPKGADDFRVPGLEPQHKNWETGNFADRFRVQVSDKPSNTVTSHMAKDGHYFIHYDPSQCRSLTVREAARIQTFPDNYFFQGNRTQQYHQVGNAVPPYLAKQIAEIVYNLFACLKI
ncbi:DNA cytosine methyltransferase [Methylomonas fluvii]|uniref:DNA (cytosine-5-)-methyltransferase n=1 Tax=Methylomonas fluvii TaxID=1854564 RepID=A0ABR9DKX6_9GAMM|nr:DNA cytosine methyltransferase [Methylomonas fluvii]MBD9363763.1 DNA cytosine methyltransferase [Methylomonas fluvii]CAD6877072.1 Modification methylase [Methylomonas fluvii]